MDTYSFSTKHLVLLAAHQGYHTLMGVPDPFMGHLADQVAADWQICKSTTIQKGYAQEINGTFILVPEIVNAIAICCNPQIFLCLLDQKCSEGISVFSSYSSIQKALLIVSENTATIYLFDKKEDELINDSFLGTLKLAEELITFDAFSLSQDNYNHICNLNKCESIRLELFGSGLDQNTINELITTISMPIRKYILCYGAFSTNLPEVHSVGVHVGEKMAIKVKSYSANLEEFVEISPFCLGEFDAFFRDLCNL